MRQVGTHWTLATGGVMPQGDAGYDAVLDARTGAVATRFGVWQLATGSPDGRPLPTRLVVHRWTAGRTQFGVLDLARGAARPVPAGWVAGQVTGCAADDRYVACRTPAGNPGLWRLNG